MGLVNGCYQGSLPTAVTNEGSPMMFADGACQWSLPATAVLDERCSANHHQEPLPTDTREIDKPLLTSNGRFRGNLINGTRL
jgi:hypothetical protein